MNKCPKMLGNTSKESHGIAGTSILELSLSCSFSQRILKEMNGKSHKKCPKVTEDWPIGIFEICIWIAQIVPPPTKAPSRLEFIDNVPHPTRIPERIPHGLKWSRRGDGFWKYRCGTLSTSLWKMKRKQRGNKKEVNRQSLIGRWQYFAPKPFKFKWDLTYASGHRESAFLYKWHSRPTACENSPSLVSNLSNLSTKGVNKIENKKNLPTIYGRIPDNPVKCWRLQLWKRNYSTGP